MIKQKENLNQYSDKDLNEFKDLIENKLAKATQDFNFMKDQLTDLVEAKEREGDWMDDTSTGMNIEMLSGMANRLKKHIQDLEFALLRIENKTYGVCTVTGELIDKRRLLAVPATTKSVLGKSQVPPKAASVIGDEQKPKKETKSTKPKIFSRIISKPPASKKVSKDDINLYGDDSEDDYGDDYDYNDFDRIDLSDSTSEE